MARTGWSRSTVERLRGDLANLGFMVADGYVRRPGSRKATKKWRLVLPPAAQETLGLAAAQTKEPSSPSQAEATA